MSQIMYKLSFNLLRNFTKLESASGSILLIATLLALLCANTPLYPIYTAIFTRSLDFNLAGSVVKINLLQTINHGLMSLFFLIVTLEIKRELLDGELKTLKTSFLPLIAAFGGMLIPGLIFVALNFNKPEYLNGWAIPIATDIAFSLGILSLLKARAAPYLTVFLTALAIIDDIGAIIVIALFYANTISIVFFSLGLVCFMLLCLCNYLKIQSLLPYLILGLLLWILISLSGIHPSIAGVLIALTIPYQKAANTESSPLTILENHLHPWVAFSIIPLFAFANAGLHIVDLNKQLITSSLVLGIFLGLFIGKPIGVFTFSWLSTKLKITRLSSEIQWREMFGVANLCGIGFTMSLFISTLAFPQASSLISDSIKFSILTASFASSICGYLLLAVTSRS